MNLRLVILGHMTTTGPMVGMTLLIASPELHGAGRDSSHMEGNGRRQSANASTIEPHRGMGPITGWHNF